MNPLSAILKSSLVALLLLAANTLQAAENTNDAMALKGMHTGKGVYLVDIGQPEKLAFYLQVILETHQSMEQQRVKPDFVLVYIGPSVRYLTSQPSDEIAMEFGDQLQSIADSVAILDKLGVRQEICALATRVFKIDNRQVLPGLSLVGNGFNSLIGWQDKGYHLVPVF